MKGCKEVIDASYSMSLPPFTRGAAEVFEEAQVQGAEAKREIDPIGHSNATRAAAFSPVLLPCGVQDDPDPRTVMAQLLGGKQSDRMQDARTQREKARKGKRRDRVYEIR
jgi:hypothetical protein